MKFNLTALSAAAAVLLASPAFADVTIYITGSTAFRAATSNAILHKMSFAGGQGYAFTGTSFTGSNNQVFVGSVTGITGTVTVKTNWSGAVAGIKALTTSQSLSFLDYPATTGTAYTLNSSTGTASVNANNLNTTSVADVSMADNWQASTSYTNPSLTGGGVVGVVPFAWVSSASAPSGLTNMTPQLARSLFSSGFCSAALFTNNPADASDQSAGAMVYAIGRDPLSGTRLVTFAESGIGIFSAVAQYQPSVNGVNGSTVNGISGTTITNINQTAIDASIPTTSPGQTGYGSGGTLADTLRYTTTSVTDDTLGTLVGGQATPTGYMCFVSYLGESDASRAVNGIGSGVLANTNVGCRYLSYNGVSAFGGAVVTVTGNVDASGNITLTSGTTTGLIVGQLVRSNGLVGDSYITSITDSTHFAVSNPPGTAYTVGSGLSISTSNLLPKAIWDGAYTMWGYERILWKSTLAGDKLTFANALKTQITTVDYFSSGLNVTNMRVNRTTDGGNVTQTY
jgi:hypothetical protein